LELFENESADSFTNGRSNERKIGSLFDPLLFPNTCEDVDIIDNEINRKPVGILQLMAELDVHCDPKQAEPPNDTCSDVAYNPNPIPCTFITVAPVEGMAICWNADMVKYWSSASLTADMLLANETIVTKMPGWLRTERNTLVKMRESQSQCVTAAEDKLFNERTRALESHRPNPNAPNVNNEEEVTAQVDFESLAVLATGKVLI
jgi:hypothetical protein